MSSRADFLSAVTVAAAAAAAPRFPDGLRKPPALRRGDAVGLIAPASPPETYDVELARAHVESFGLVPVLGEHVRAHDGYLAGTDAERAADFNRMARDRSIRAIVAVRGGYGTMRILEALDYAALRDDPKIVMGFSDLTAILNAVTMRSQIVTFHGPLGSHGSSWSGQERGLIEQTLFSQRAIGTLKVPNPHRIAGGRARGRLAGGNLALVSALIGTPYAIPSTASLLFLEETEEAPYRIDRMLTQLDLAGDLRAAHGLLFGQCTKCVGEAPTPPASDVIAQGLRAAGRPALAGAPFGHIPSQWILPIGLPAELDADAATLTISQAAVR